MRAEIAPGQLVSADASGRRLLLHTPELGERCRCRGCGVRRATPKAVWNRWTPEQDATLKRLYGRLGATQIGAELGRLHNVPRTATAVMNRARLLGLVGARFGRALSPCRLADLLGVSPVTVRRWIAEGKLAAFDRTQTGTRYRHLAIRREDVERFLRDHPRLVDWRAITDVGLRAVAEVANRRVRHLSLAEVSHLVGVGRRTLWTWLIDGEIPGAWLAEGVRGGHGGKCKGWRVPETSLPALRRRKTEHRQRNLASLERARAARAERIGGSREGVAS